MTSGRGTARVSTVERFSPSKSPTRHPRRRLLVEVARSACGRSSHLRITSADSERNREKNPWHVRRGIAPGRPFAHRRRRPRAACRAGPVPWTQRPLRDDHVLDASFTRLVRLLLPASARPEGDRGLGGHDRMSAERRYRTTLVLGQLLGDRGPAWRMCCRAQLPCRRSTWRRSRPAGAGEDPVPGFVGPLSVEFEGLDDDRDAFVAVRVWKPGGRRERGGDAHGTRSGSSTGSDTSSPSRRASRLPPAPGDGGRRRRTRTGAECDELRNRSARCAPSPSGSLRSGRSHRLEPSGRPLCGFLQGPCRPTIFLGYCVEERSRRGRRHDREHGTARDDPGQLVRFLPAVVSVSFGLRNLRTELSLGRAAYVLYLPKRISSTVTWRAAGVSRRLVLSVALDEGRRRCTFPTPSRGSGQMARRFRPETSRGRSRSGAVTRKAPRLFSERGRPREHEGRLS